MADESIKVPIDGDTKGFDKSVEGMRGTISAASVAMGNMLSLIHISEPTRRS